jgi:16S rRNA (cytidine1402-2'-O)-methyltransferase
MPLPGPSSVTTVLSAAGITDDQPGGFVFAGFLSSKAAERERAVLALASETRAIVVLEAPHRIEALALALAALGKRTITVGRELTKQFEEIATVSAQDLPTWLSQDTNRLRGEFALVVHPAPAQTNTAQDTRVLKLLLEHLPLKTAVKLAADITGEPRNTLYQSALELKSESAV